MMREARGDNPVRRQKVFAYITSERQGVPHLLIFAHPDAPDAGLQVPAGTVEPSEELVVAALREATEETGLTQLRMIAHLGDEDVDVRPFGKNELHARSFFHIACDETTPDTWETWEHHASDGSGPHRFAHRWVPLDAVPPLIAGHGAFLGQLRRRAPL